ncbi:MAG: rhomboid family intramembrane serine protease [Lentimicrobiaceae bacterium]|jgi:rhomboid protease GluP
MAVGFTPKHIEEVPLYGLTKEEYLVIALEAAKEMKWKVSYTSNNGLIAFTDKGMFSWNAEIKIKIENGSANLKSSSTGNEMMDWGKNKQNIEKFILLFNALKLKLTKEELVLKYEELSANLAPEEDDILKLPPPTTTEQITGFFTIFRPTKGFFVTPLLLDINILLFILMVISGVNIMLPDNESLLKWGANFRPLTMEGEWWRLITNCFLHIGIFHLLMNMYALLYIGVLLEPLLGRTRFISAYLLTGITASIASLWWHDLIISAGASGAIFGMYGVFLAMLTTNLIEKTTRKALLTSIAIFVGYNLIYGLKGGIDNAAHIGGLIGGIIIGYAFIPSLKKPEDVKLKLSTIGLLTLLILTSSFIVYKNTSNDIGKYDKKIKTFVSNESMAIEVFNLPENTPKDQLLYGLKERGIYYWNENIKLLDEVEKLDLPSEIHNKNSKLKQYCELRIKSYELYYKTISEDTHIYKFQIENFERQIGTIINELKGDQQGK